MYSVPSEGAAGYKVQEGGEANSRNLVKENCLPRRQDQGTPSPPVARRKISSNVTNPKNFQLQNFRFSVATHIIVVSIGTGVQLPTGEGDEPVH